MQEPGQGWEAVLGPGPGVPGQEPGAGRGLPRVQGLDQDLGPAAAVVPEQELELGQGLGQGLGEV